MSRLARGNSFFSAAGVAVFAVSAAVLCGPVPALAAAPSAAPAPPGGATPQAAAAPVAPAAATIHFAPQAQGSASYTLNAHFDVMTKEVTFDAPPAYKESFAFWSARMKGNRRNELYEFVTLTEEPAADKTVHFRRVLSRFQVDLERNGETLAPMTMASKDMTGQAWEGTLDPFGNIKDVRRVAGEDTGDMAELATPYVMEIFPFVDGPRDLKVGETLKSSVVLPLPSPLHMPGLENVRVLLTRELTLQQVGGNLARFEVKTTYADAPAPEGKGPSGGASCKVSGGGTGVMNFDLRRGVFLTADQPGDMTLEISAPLRPLPDHPETEKAGNGKSRIELRINTTGGLVVHRLVGED